MQRPQQTEHKPPQETAAGRLALAFELHEFGVAMMRQRLLRDYPDAPPAEIDARVAAWLQAVPPPESTASESRGRSSPSNESPTTGPTGAIISW